MDPPTYEPDRQQAEPVLLNLCPLPNASSYLVGTLGFGSGSVQGEVQIKCSHTAGVEGGGARYDKLVVELVGKESRDRVEPIVFVEERVVVWDGTAPRSSSSTATATTSTNLPTSSTFSLNLTNDLPHCIHRLDSSLDYTLSATLTGPSAPPVTRRTPIHLERNTNPAQPIHADVPSPLTLTDPVESTVQLAKTVFRRSEVIGLVARVEVPSPKVVQHDNLRLRTVSAELVRSISVKGEDMERPHLMSHGSATSRGKENAERNWDEQAQAGSSQPSPLDQTSPPELPVPIATDQSPPVQTTVLSRSGKSCRFSPNKPVVLKLLLHPPTEVNCESITQSTILHHISFEIRVVIGIINQQTHARQEHVLTQEVTLLPDWPAPSAVALEKQREVRAEAEEDEDGRVPTYNESSSDLVSAFAPTTYIGDMEPPPGWDEEEYDGYEELSAEASSVPPPPPIDEDVSPPSAAEAGAEAAPTGIGLLQARMEQLQLDQRPPLPSAAATPTLGTDPSSSEATDPPPVSPSDVLAPPLPPAFTSSAASPPAAPTGLPPPYAGDGPPSYASSQPGQLVGVTDQGILYTLRR